MLCCFDAPWRDPNDAYRRQTSEGLSRYPGQRAGLVKTGGNALAAYGPGHHGADASGSNSLVSVTVPPGVSPGQSIRVSAPDGSGRIMSAVVPPGMSQGSTFMVEFPPQNGTAAPPASPQPPNPTYDGVSVMAPPSPPAPQYQGVTVLPPPTSTTIDPPYAKATPISSDPNAAAPFAFALGPELSASASPVVASQVVASPITSSPVPAVPPPSNTGQAMVKVQVPPGTAPGSIIHVQVPGENRMIAAQVPPGVTEFHVAFQPSRSLNPPAPAASQAEKLLLVRVPPGIAPGTTMHVRIPDEPGRVVAAKVPPGNVNEFHVSYVPRNQGARAQSTNSGNCRNNQNGRGSGMGNMMLPLLGGAAMGAATMAMFDHHHYNNSGGYDGNGDTGDYGDDYGDFGGDLGDF